MMWDGMKGNTRTVNIMVKEFPVILGGSKYEGKWKDGEKHGQGTLTSPGGDKYVGKFKNGAFHGQGVCTYVDGTKYVGAFLFGEYSGNGTHTYSDGAKYMKVNSRMGSHKVKESSPNLMGQSI